MSNIFSQKNLPLFLWGVGLFLLFILFSYFVHRNSFVHLDFNTTVRLQDHISRRFDAWFSALSDIGTFEVVSVVLLLFLIIRRKLMGLFVIIFYGALHLIEIYGKTFVSHLPPPEFMLRTQHVVVFPEFHVTLQNSYPSGHAGRALFLTTFLGILSLHSSKLSRTQKVFIIAGLSLYDIAMSVSRIYLGEHWLSDVVGGALLGCSFGLFAALALV